jgi:membrane protease subunit (stomatin/prohibitin family)
MGLLRGLNNLMYDTSNTVGNAMWTSRTLSDAKVSLERHRMTKEQKKAAMLTWTCKCGTESMAKFCGSCGAAKPEPIPCPSCRQASFEKFCPNCGTKIEGNE